MFNQDLMEKRLARALKVAGDTFTLAQILEGMAQGRFQGFAHNNAWAVTEILLAPTGFKTLFVLFAVGDKLEDVLRLNIVLENFCLENGIAKIQAVGRTGWRKYALALGWKETGIQYERCVGEPTGRPN